MIANQGTRRWALVTGATGGIGSEMCRQLACRGWDVMISGRDEGRLDLLARELGASGARTRVLVADLADPAGAKRLAAAALASGDPIDLLVNNAGLGCSLPYLDAPVERQLDLLRVDVMALAELTHRLGAPMTERGYGAVLNVASVAGTMPGPYMSTYFASKAFVLSLSQALHEELAPRGVNVMALCPGPVRTGFWRTADTDVSVLDPIMLTPEEVCRIALTSLERGRAVCAPGLLSKVCYSFGRIAPATLSRKVAGRFNRL